MGCLEVGKIKVSSKQEKRYNELKEELELAVAMCRDRKIQAEKHIYAEKLGYAIEILENMQKIKPLSASNRVGLKFMKESHAMIVKGRPRHLLKVVNPMNMRKYHRQAKRAEKKDEKDED